MAAKFEILSPIEEAVAAKLEQETETNKIDEPPVDKGEEEEAVKVEEEVNEPDLETENKADEPEVEPEPDNNEPPSNEAVAPEPLKGDFCPQEDRRL